MAANFKVVDRDSPMLFPPDLRDWVSKQDLVHFVIDAAEACDTSKAKVNYRGSGSAQYQPSMMLALLIYCYANRIFSSRDIEQATYWHVGARYICGGQNHPDHDTIATFRRENEALFVECFLSVLLLAKEMKVCKRFGVISIDGTKIASRANQASNHTLSRLQLEIAGLQEQIDQLIKEAQGAEEAATEEDSLPTPLQEKRERKKALEEAKRQLEERLKLSAKEPEEQPDKPKKPLSKKKQKQLDNLSINLEEPDSRLMRDANAGYIQAYNVHAAVDSGGSQLILGVRVSQEGNDRRAFGATFESIPEAIRNEITHVLADSGFDNAEIINKVEQKTGVMALCPPQSQGAPMAGKTYRINPQQRRYLDYAEEMRERLGHPELQKLYSRRSATIEPVFGVLKNVLGFRRFRTFGKAMASIEVLLAACAYNLRKMTQLIPRMAQAA